MNNDFRLASDFPTNRKYRRLKHKLGKEAALAWVELLAYVARRKSAGALSGLDADDIAMEADYDGDAEEFVAALVELKLLDRPDDGGFAIHDWTEWNPWAAGAAERSQLARQNARKQWENVPADERSERMSQLAHKKHHSQPKEEVCERAARSVRANRSQDASGPASSSLLFSSPNLFSPKKEDHSKKDHFSFLEGGSGGKSEKKEKVLVGGQVVPLRPKNATPLLKRPTRIPENFALTQERFQAAVEAGLPSDQVMHAFDYFICYWRGKPGDKGISQDWDSEWRRRCLYLAQQPGRENIHLNNKDRALAQAVEDYERIYRDYDADAVEAK